MPSYLILAAMKGRFVSEQGHTYDNFQMMGYSEGADPLSAVAAFFDQPPYPIVWGDVEYLWAERFSSLLFGLGQVARLWDASVLSP